MKTIRDYFQFVNQNFENRLTKSDVYELLEQTLKRSYADIVLNMDDKLKAEEIQKLDDAISLLKTDYPLAYITKRQYFYKNYFYVNSDVLIPRTETELMVENSFNFIQENYLDKDLVCYDICTGSGVVGLSLKNLDNQIDLYLSDISSKALLVAKENSVLLHEDNVKFIQGDFLNPFLKDQKIPRANLITINPPYIDINDPFVEESVRKYEPHLALFADDNGLIFYEKVAKNYEKLVNLKEKWMIMMEFGWKQKEQIEAIFKQNIKENIKIDFIKDNSNNWRFVKIHN
ncbi:peptide chain release factor N(5)-glutamine methyltransferase [Mesoplasma lactucae]|uniref:peptide chain release factor N(5)-glutamine methyltransferase n=1 Tax=Mesoplasma lactucae ATCC 49193 TaxID=81460 RepID=A0A291ISN4_9MOLU|nr:peptide chain release factor N(5)-glutamine methyltransferase [Mesoplasma lactucae]ATG97763.1 protein-(glutamine-N5) methyltransferase, release factor-specific [Mesoplasma lactucae ATCC 49193]ATZ20460.1 N5-glutamine S-adenosyl-L-methionine-dependent methyltransferase [Mesoplasma lactucae ATCC 49193]MCL8216632.1 Release factor glutamine methyltransferase [Mesoplasma lactucae ATCC 49193]